VSDAAISALNGILSEVIDVVQDVKQAHRKVSDTHALHAEIDQLGEDLGAWARVLIVQDEALGVSPLANMPSVAGRTPPNLWPGTATDDAVCALLDEHLGRLENHVTAALAEQSDAGSRASLGDVLAGVVAHRVALREVGGG
jgi:hypothetical protein